MTQRNPPPCPKCQQPMKEQDTWTDVHHYVCFECHTEKTPIRDDVGRYRFDDGGAHAPKVTKLQNPQTRFTTAADKKEERHDTNRIAAYKSSSRGSAILG